MLRKIIHINKPYVGDMSWLLIDYTDISLNNLEARKTYLYIRQQTPLHQILVIIGFIFTKFTQMMHLIICSMNAESEPQASDVGGG